MSNDKTKKIFQKYNIKEENHSQPGLTWLTHDPRYEIGIKKNRILKEEPSKKDHSSIKKKTKKQSNLG